MTPLNKKLNILYLYPGLLNLYGDNGNIEILKSRSQARGMEVQVTHVGIDDPFDEALLKNTDVVFMGGGPDAQQKLLYKDFLENKGPLLQDYIRDGGVGLYICGAYQLLGRYYKAADGSTINGLGVLDLYTESFGLHKPRCIGNTVAEINPDLAADAVFAAVNHIGTTLVGFENHGGRTYLGEGLLPLATIKTGHGNNSEDGTEGVWYKNSIGTYFHGPLLAKNPHIADYLIAQGLGVSSLEPLDDLLIKSAHLAAQKLKQ